MCTCNHQYALRPEFEMLFNEAYEYKRQAPPRRWTRVPAVPNKPRCVGEMDITTDFRNFITRAQSIIGKSRTLSKSGISGAINMMNAIVSSEAGIDINNFKVLACSTINNPLLLWGETAGAEIDITGKTLRLTNTTWGLSAEFTQNKDFAALISFFQTIAHEKRHA